MNRLSGLTVSSNITNKFLREEFIARYNTNKTKSNHIRNYYHFEYKIFKTINLGVLNDFNSLRAAALNV